MLDLTWLHDQDSYKYSHPYQYPPNTTSMFSYVESRGGDYPSTVFFGLQYYLNRYLSHRITMKEVNEVDGFCKAHGVPFHREGYEYIVKSLGGALPVRIRAVPEGTVLPTSNVLISIESTDPKVFWAVSAIETLLLRVWYPITVATRSRHIKSIIYKYLQATSDDADAEISFKLHDFGSRGSSSQESAQIGGAAHLVNFLGSDTTPGIWAANHYYHSEMAGFSIPAMEHSSVTSWGRDHEVDAYRNMLTHFGKPNALIACVSDSYDIYNACSKIWGEQLKEEVIKSGATVIIRPDSGNPPEVVLNVTKLLDEKFGSTINSKGKKVLNHVRVIQGDGINEQSIGYILENLTDHGYSATNIAFGMGGQLLQGLNRDTLRFALKCSSIKQLGKNVDVSKDPITDPGKKSKAGRLDLIKWVNPTNQEVKFQTVRLRDEEIQNEFSYMRTVFENGNILVDEDMKTIRARAK